VSRRRRRGGAEGRYFAHRLRLVTGKDANPLNEVELMSHSLMNSEGSCAATT
jgi:hypothetical protein